MLTDVIVFCIVLKMFVWQLQFVLWPSPQSLLKVDVTAFSMLIMSIFFEVELKLDSTYCTILCHPCFYLIICSILHFVYGDNLALISSLNSLTFDVSLNSKDSIF